jgi:hypothetical protein
LDDHSYVGRASQDVQLRVRGLRIYAQVHGEGEPLHWRFRRGDPAMLTQLLRLANGMMNS